ncbi:MAG: HAD hydrolase family protein [Bacteroidia bacterium]|nr:HAD hydrolase family protein [Bacteroidia bacterium]
MNHLAGNLTFLREQRGWSRTELEQKVGQGFHSQFIESENLEPTLDELIRLGEIFNLPLDRLLRRDLKAEYELNLNQKISLLVLDIDGVLTDGGMFFGESGEEFKRFDSKDGRAIINLGRSGVKVAFLSSGIKDGAIRNRALRVGVKLVHVGTEPKEEILQGWINDLGISWENVAFVGDDVNDKEVIARVGLSACPSDAVDLIKNAVHVVLNHPGGHGAVREFVEHFLLPIV